MTLTQAQHDRLIGLLLPGDGLEAAALLLCGRRAGGDHHRLLAHRIIEVPRSAYTRRTADQLIWNTDFLVPHLEDAARDHLAVVKLHSHPSGYADFSRADDRADAILFPSLHGWTDDGLPHASAIMLPDGRLFGRTHLADGQNLPLRRVFVVGDRFTVWPHPSSNDVAVPGAAVRTAQAFGEATYRALRSLKIGVVGCSGTGSVVIELLARLMVGQLVLIDPDRIEDKNLNRIIGATSADIGSLKVSVLARHIDRMGLGTNVDAHASDLAQSDALLAIAGCDWLFGCMDSVDGRHLLNRIATFYTLPYVDMGVRLESNGRGGVQQICGSVHYLKPGGSTLLSRELYTLEQLRAANLRRAAPSLYENERAERYISGVDEARPAVAPVNTLFASRAVLELLARLHPFRIDPAADFAVLTESISGGFLLRSTGGAPDALLVPYVGRGDCSPLLDLPLATAPA